MASSAVSAEPSAWSAVIAVDLGTHGTSYAIAFPSGETDLAQLGKDIIPRCPGSSSGACLGPLCCRCGVHTCRSARHAHFCIAAGVEKALSAVLVNKQTSRMIAMGEEARRCFAEALDCKDTNLRWVAQR